jgi:hypothetical protein
MSLKPEAQTNMQNPSGPKTRGPNLQVGNPRAQNPKPKPARRPKTPRKYRKSPKTQEKYRKSPKTQENTEKAQKLQKKPSNPNPSAAAEVDSGVGEARADHAPASADHSPARGYHAPAQGHPVGTESSDVTQGGGRRGASMGERGGRCQIWFFQTKSGHHPSARGAAESAGGSGVKRGGRRSRRKCVAERESGGKTGQERQRQIWDMPENALEGETERRCAGERQRQTRRRTAKLRQHKAWSGGGRRRSC